MRNYAFISLTRHFSFHFSLSMFHMYLGVLLFLFIFEIFLSLLNFMIPFRCNSSILRQEGVDCLKRKEVYLKFVDWHRVSFFHFMGQSSWFCVWRMDMLKIRERGRRKIYHIVVSKSLKLNLLPSRQQHIFNYIR